jgi:hypothetical protein
LYSIFSLIDPLSFSPISGAEYPYDIRPECEPDGDDSNPDAALTIMAVFLAAVRFILNDNAVRVEKRALGQEE